MAMKSTSPFARLFRPSVKAADDDKMEDLVDDKADEAEDNLADPDAPDEDDTPEEAAAKRARRRAKKAKAKKAEGDDQSDDDDSMDAKASAARARERGRVASDHGFFGSRCQSQRRAPIGAQDEFDPRGGDRGVGRYQS